MIRLILHADDLGLHSAVNQAVFEGAEAGVLTSASIMVNGRAAAEALDWSKQNRGFGLGLHLNILRGQPLSDPADIPTLVDENGLFLNSAFKLLMRGMRGRISAEEVLIEYKRQLACLSEQGVTPSHFDGEKHSHLFLPQTAWATGRLMAESGINKLRLINETVLINKMKKQGIYLKGSVTQKLKLIFLESRTKRLSTVSKDCQGPDYTFGVLLSGRTSKAETKRLLEALLLLPENGTVEWMFHPGYPFADDEPDFTREFGSFFLKDARDQERNILQSPEIRGLLQKHRQQLISYREL